MVGESEGIPMEHSWYAHRWALGARLAALICILPLVISSVIFFSPRLWNPCAEADAMVWLVVFLPATLPYLHILYRLRLRGKPDERGLALAVGVGSLAGALGILLVVRALPRIADDLAGLTGVFLVITQTGLVASAIKTYYSTERDGSDRKRLGRGFASAAAYMGLVFVMVVGVPGSLSSGSRSRRAAEAVIVLRTINTAEAEYAEKYGKGFSSGLGELGPPAPGGSPGASAANLLDAAAAAGNNRLYTFTYIPGPPDAEGRIASYTLTAHPSDPRCKGWLSFFTSDSGVIRSTSDARPATEDDPPIPM